MAITVLFASRNGERWLPLMLEALTKLQAPEGGYDIVAVDNGSSDGTANILKSYLGRLPLTVLSQPLAGKNRAINLGLEYTTADLAVFTDDDVVPAPDWLIRFREAALNFPDVGVFAGQVRHLWQKEPPQWLVRMAEEGSAYAGTSVIRGDGPIPGSQVKGPNFMVRRHLLEKFEFNEEIGPNGTRNYIAGSETSLLLSMEKAGISLRFVSSAVVQHIIRPEQISLLAMLARCFRIGKGTHVLGIHTVDASASTVFGYPRYVVRRLFELLFGALWQWARADTYGAATRLIKGATIAGAAHACRQQRNRTPQRSLPVE